MFKLEPEPHQNFHPEPDPQKNDAALQHCKKIRKRIIKVKFFSPHLKFEICTLP
jgi:hypothetical protein